MVQRDAAWPVLEEHPLMTVLPTHSRPTINDLCGTLVKQPSRIEFLPGFFNYGRGEGAEAAWIEAIVSLMPVCKEQARDVLLSLLKHNLTLPALTHVLGASQMSVQSSIDAFMHLVCGSDALMQVMSHHPQDALYYYTHHIECT